MALTLLIGGARSGKSALAVDIGHRHHAAGIAVTYIATATALDDDMADRIERHQSERPSGWTTIEETTDLVGAIERVPNGLAIIDCLTLWTSNLMWQDLTDDAIGDAARDAAARAAGRDDPTVVITNEVGLGIHPDTDLGRRYRDVLGRVNQIWAAVADPTLLMVAGRATRLDDPRTLLP
ncbi:bifunctional adenosylcobinamide kinase/adenosylcobinamide-phosphate guanylyltransferase [Ilumatobacter nonamiensis]|uniref:bifunctional adenosylcobinamide kinase/adenosylcobinamide-phosphate guanylyltransferase n=1 Tax=Ilumatobacter nonamiensis TaxID=467093 RepID=UPI000346CE10|nr:bifunctional adenosylcobinamide kinase/adenosylcobinamide-phosphate guanylyltransferase [Ilumatobacter nonamiensis]